MEQEAQGIYPPNSFGVFNLDEGEDVGDATWYATQASAVAAIERTAGSFDAGGLTLVWTDEKGQLTE